ncbi:hypothetical protein CYLTODRAFT_148302 [Cylindrobasidium torrendii FP15055 ss-10]|uniref:Uncharacterized protein n=1 Tax=Cylindrobasidium torrendii FP15055 ss-10 TaxID=1314674 RepID=A0A0D7BKH9_9AGAR|nr:hypothetical protein CYLTODRAFT_148302 [Cylindrobasidium torrendii FP15055 ss-10]
MPCSRSNTFDASIMSWAAAVQPGSPAPPSPATPATGKSAYTPTSAHQFDLTALGYTSVFVHLPKTPTTPDHEKDNKRLPLSEKTRQKARRGDGYVRLDNNESDREDNYYLHPDLKYNKQSLDITCDGPSSDGTSPSRRQPVFGLSRARIARRQAMSTAAVPARSGKNLPPSLMNELLLLQFTSGGKIDAHMARALEQGAVADNKGGVYWDEEFVPLVSAPKKDRSGKDKKKRPAPLNIIPPNDPNVVPALPTAATTKKTGKVRAFFSRS